MPRSESMIPEVRRVLAGHYRPTRGYATFRSRGTTDYLLVHTLSGAGQFRSGTGSSLLAGAGTAVLVEPGAVHDYGIAADEDHWELVFAHFHPRPEWAPLLRWPQRDPGFGLIACQGDAADNAVTALDSAARYCRGLLPHGELFAANALEAALIWYDLQNPRSRLLDERILRVLDVIERAPAALHSTPSLAKVSNLSVSRFAQLFLQQTGLTPQRYVESQRLTTAAQLLELTDRPIAAIAREVGFNDPLYFSSRFRRHIGMSPRDYRNRRAEM